MRELVRGGRYSLTYVRVAFTTATPTLGIGCEKVILSHALSGIGPVASPQPKPRYTGEPGQGRADWRPMDHRIRNMKQMQCMAFLNS